MNNSILEARHITKFFHDPVDVKVLDDITFNVKKEEFISVVGKSGCGKSTLLYILSTMDTDFEGDLLLDGGVSRFAWRLVPLITIIANLGMAVIHIVLDLLGLLPYPLPQALLVGLTVYAYIPLAARFELGGVRLRPLRGAQEARLLTVPTGVDQGAARPPALFEQLADRLRFRHQRNLAGQRVGRAEYPTIMMIAAHDPSVRLLRAAQRCNHVVQRLLAPVR